MRMYFVYITEMLQFKHMAENFAVKCQSRTIPYFGKGIDVSIYVFDADAADTISLFGLGFALLSKSIRESEIDDV